MASINRGDNTASFGNDFLRIYLNNPNHLYISRALVQVNRDIEKEFIDPIFPLRVNFTGEETESFHQTNTIKLALWDEYGRRRTADGKFTFFVKENPIMEPDAPTIEENPYAPEEMSVSFDLTDAEFAAQFVINATPTKMSELEQDIEIMKPENIKGGRNVHAFVDEENNVIIDADIDVVNSYNNLADKPSINGVELIGNLEIDTEPQVNADWKATEGKAKILNKPNLATVAFSGNYNDLVGAKYKVSQLENDLNFVQSEVLGDYYTKEETENLIEDELDLTRVYAKISDLEEKEIDDYTELNDKKVDKEDLDEIVSDLESADSVIKGQVTRVKNSVNSLSATVEGKADKTALNTIAEQVDNCVTEDVFEGTVELLATKAELQNGLADKLDKDELNKGKLTIKRNNITVGTFSANNLSDVTANISVPEKTSELTNDAGFVTAEDVDLDNFYNKIQVNDLLAGKADITSVGSGIITLKENGEIKGSFNLNQNTNKTIDLSMPTKISDLTQDVAYLKQEDLDGIGEQIETLEGDIDIFATRLDTLTTDLDKKVDKRNGYSLVSNTEIARVSTLKNYDDTEVRGLISSLAETVDNFDTDISNKVDKVEGKGLSTNDFTDTEKAELASAVSDLNTLKPNVSGLLSEVETLGNTVSNHTARFADVEASMSNEASIRLHKDNELLEMIEGLQAKSTVVDIVGTHADLETYDTSKLKDGDVICVLKNEVRDNTTCYYRWNAETDGFDFIGTEGSYYTKSESDGRFISNQIEINGHQLTTSFDLNADDVNALPDDTVIGNGTLVIQIQPKDMTEYKTITEIDTFDANSVQNVAVPIPVPTKVSHLQNDLEFVDINSLLDEYLGRNIPEDTVIQDEILYLQSEIDSNSAKIATLSGNLPTVALTGDYNDLLNKPEIPSRLSKLVNDTGFLSSSYDPEEYTLETVLETYATKEDLPKYVSELENDRGYITLNAVGRGVLNIYLQDELLNSFNANSKEDISITIPVDTALSSTSINPVENKVVKAELDLKAYDNKVVHNTGNETVSGTKTINSLITTTQNITDSSNKAATTQFVNSYYTDKDQYLFHLAGEETVTGNKTFLGDVVLNNATGKTVATSDNSTKLATTAWVKNQAYALDSKVVHDGGDEVINGNKTFAETTTFEGITYLGDYAHVSKADGTVLDAVVSVEYLNDIVTALQDTISALTQRVSTLESQVSTLQSQMSTAQGDITSLQTDLGTAQGNIGTLQTNVSTAQGNISTLQTDLGTANSNISTLQTNVGTAQSQITSLQARMSSSESNVSSLDSRVTHLESIVEPDEPEEP